MEQLYIYKYIWNIFSRENDPWNTALMLKRRTRDIRWNMMWDADSYNKSAAADSWWCPAQRWAERGENVRLKDYSLLWNQFTWLLWPSSGLCDPLLRLYLGLGLNFHIPNRVCRNDLILYAYRIGLRAELAWESKMAASMSDMGTSECGKKSRTQLMRWMGIQHIMKRNRIRKREVAFCSSWDVRMLALAFEDSPGRWLTGPQLPLDPAEEILSPGVEKTTVVSVLIRGPLPDSPLVGLPEVELPVLPLPAAGWSSAFPQVTAMRLIWWRMVRKMWL